MSSNEWNGKIGESGKKSPERWQKINLKET